MEEQILLNCEARKASYYPVLFLAAAVLLAGCASYPRFDDGGVVSLNSHFAGGAPLLGNSGLSKLEGSWTVTNTWTVANTYTSKRPAAPVRAGIMQFPDRESQTLRSPADVAPRKRTGRSSTVSESIYSLLENASSRSRAGQNSAISQVVTNNVETILIVEVVGEEEQLGAVIMTVETRFGGKLTERHPYLAQGTNIAGSKFIELFPGPLPMQPNYLPVWWLMRVQKQADGKLEVGRWNEAWLRKLLAKHPRTIRHALPYSKEGPIVLTDSSEAIQRFLGRQASNPEAFQVTTFHPGAGAHWPAADMKNAVRAMAAGLDSAKVGETLGKGKVFIQVGDIVNQTAEPIDTRFMSSVLQNQIGSSSQFLVLNAFSSQDSDFANDIAPRIAEATLSGTITKAQGDGGDTNSRRCVLRLTLRSRQDKILWESEKQLEMVE